MRAVIIDNYDSFTLNLYQAIAELMGAEPVILRNDAVTLDGVRALRPDCLVISPGPGHPASHRDFGVCRELLRELDVPILGVCLGCEGMAVAFGGAVVHAPTPMHGRISRLEHDGQDIFRGVPQGCEVVRYHSLAVQTPLPDVLEVTARAEDGVVMALRHRTKPIWGVQFHPESICTAYGKPMLRNFLDLAGARSLGEARWGDAVASAAPCRATKAPEEAPRLVVHRRRLKDYWTPESVFMSLYAESETAFWLDSSLVAPGLSRFSFLGDAAGPHSCTVMANVAERTLTIRDGTGVRVEAGDIFAYLKSELARNPLRADELPFDFVGGYVGYLGYELRAQCGSPSRHRSEQPDAGFMLADRFLAFDHEHETVYLVCLTSPDGLAEAETWFAGIEAALSTVAPIKPSERVDAGWSGAIRLGRSREAYLADIARAQAEILDGESYEICLTNRLHCEAAIDPLTYYRILRETNPAPYSAFLRFGDLHVLSSSPERFIRIDRARGVEAKPIKGTVRRSARRDEDERLRDALQASEKNRAENLMIVDLLRHDLGGVCEVGSVHVPRLMVVESYATVHQLVSTVRGRLRRDLDAVDCVRQAFPGGSMTGAPKLRTMEILDRIEREPRGVYSGALGFLAFNGTADMSIVIRTAVVVDGTLTIGVGGAITSLSDAEEEYAEAMLKGEALLRALRQTPVGRRRVSLPAT